MPGALRRSSLAHGLFRLTYDDTQVSSCSQTFDVSTTRGAVALDLRAPDRVVLTIERTVESAGLARDVGRRYRHAQPAERCRWEGTAVRSTTTTTTLQLRLTRPAPFDCSWDGQSGGSPLESLVLSCVTSEVALRQATGQRRHPVLVCSVEGRPPRVLRQTTFDGATPLSRDPGLHLRRSTDPTMISGQLQRSDGSTIIGGGTEQHLELRPTRPGP